MMMLCNDLHLGSNLLLGMLQMSQITGKIFFPLASLIEMGLLIQYVSHHNQGCYYISFSYHFCFYNQKSFQCLQLICFWIIVFRNLTEILTGQMYLSQSLTGVTTNL